MTTAAAGLVVFRRIAQNIEYLLLQTSYGIHHWTPPKGHLDPGEDEMTAAIRETEEEAGLKQADLRILESSPLTIEYNVKNKKKTVKYWPAELKNPQTEVHLSDEHQDFKWLDIQDACKLAEFKEMQNTLLYFHKKLTT